MITCVTPTVLPVELSGFSLGQVAAIDYPHGHTEHWLGGGS